MELVVLGTGTVAPTADRCPAAYWVEAGPTRLLLDCGPGCLRRAAEYAIPWRDMIAVVLTHFHPDHWAELPYLLMALRWGTEPARVEPLRLIGPTGLRARLEHVAEAMGAWVQEPGFPLRVEEISPDTRVELGNGADLEAFDTPHTDESLAYAVGAQGRRLVYTGDTGPSDALGDWARGCDLLLCECSLPEERAVDIHLTPAQAGALARRAGAGRLVLTHFYPPVEAADPAAAASAVFNGEVAAARDGDRFAI